MMLAPRRNLHVIATSSLSCHAAAQKRQQSREQPREDPQPLQAQAVKLSQDFAPSTDLLDRFLLAAPASPLRRPISTSARLLRCYELCRAMEQTTRACDQQGAFLEKPVIQRFLDALLCEIGPHRLPFRHVMPYLARLPLEQLRSDRKLAATVVELLGKTQEPIVLDWMLSRFPMWLQEPRVLPALMDALSHRPPSPLLPERMLQLYRRFRRHDRPSATTSTAATDAWSTEERDKVTMGMLRMYARKGAVRPALSLAKTQHFQHSWNPSSHAYALLLQTHVRALEAGGGGSSSDITASLFQSAASLFQQCLLGGKQSEETYREMLACHSLARRSPAEAEALLAEGLAQGIRPSADLFAQLIRGHARRGSLPDALRVFQEQEELGVAPTAETYRYLFGACHRAAIWKRGSQNASVDLHFCHTKLVQLQRDMRLRGVLDSEHSALAYVRALSSGGPFEAELTQYITSLLWNTPFPLTDRLVTAVLSVFHSFPATDQHARVQTLEHGVRLGKLLLESKQVLGDRYRRGRELTLRSRREFQNLVRAAWRESQQVQAANVSE